MHFTNEYMSRVEHECSTCMTSRVKRGLQTCSESVAIIMRIGAVWSERYTFNYVIRDHIFTEWRENKLTYSIRPCGYASWPKATMSTYGIRTIFTRRSSYSNSVAQDQPANTGSHVCVASGQPECQWSGAKLFRFIKKMFGSCAYNIWEHFELWMRLLYS